MRPKLITDVELLEVARECFLVRGPSVSTTFIAEQAGVSQATIFKRFGTKRSLVGKALGLPDVSIWLVQIEAGPDHRPIEDQLRVFARAIVSFYAKAIPALMAFRAAGHHFDPDHGDENSVCGPARARLALTRWFDKAQEAGRIRFLDSKVAAIAFIGSLQAPSISQHLMDDEIELDGYADEFVGLFWSGIKP